MSDETLTPEALQWLQGMAKDAERDLARLPIGSQPLWFRLHTHHQKETK